MNTMNTFNLEPTFLATRYAVGSTNDVHAAISSLSDGVKHNYHEDHHDNHNHHDNHIHNQICSGQRRRCACWDEYYCDDYDDDYDNADDGHNDAAADDDDDDVDDADDGYNDAAADDDAADDDTADGATDDDVWLIEPRENSDRKFWVPLSC